MKRYWLWGAIGAGLLLLTVLAVPQAPRDNRIGQTQDPRVADQMGPQGTPTRSSPNVNDLGIAGRDALERRAEPITPARLNMRVTNAAESIDGVKRAWAITRGTTALVGLELERAVTDPAERSTREEVEEQVEELPEIERAEVTTNPATVNRIRRVNESIAEGNPPEQYDTEVRELLRLLSPNAK